MIRVKCTKSGSIHRTHLSLILGATALTTTLVPHSAFAQSAGYEDGTIIVTAQRRAQALEEVPMSVTALSQETLANAGVSSVQDIQNVTSGFALGRGGSTPQPAIRGITTLINGNYENNVAVYFDGLYQPSPTIANIDLPNIASVQVLKGPQGTLYGRNATGGALLIDTIGPKDRWEGKAEATYARFDDKRLGGYVAGPITENMGISLAAYTRRTDGYFKEMSRTNPGEHVGSYWPTKQDAFRGKLSLDLSETFNVEVGYNYTRAEDGRGVHFSVIENVERFFLQSGGNTRPIVLGETANDPLPGTDERPTVAAKQNEFYMKLKLDTGIGEIRSITGYAKNHIDTNFDFDGSYIPAVYGVNGINDKILQQTVDWNIDAIENVDLIVGGQYINLKTDTFYDSWAGGPYLGRPYDPTQPPTLASQGITSRTEGYRTKEAWAGFADATVHFGPASITLGGRYSEETQHIQAYKWGAGGLAGNSQGVVTVVYSPAFNGADKKSKYKKFTPRASIRFELAPRTNVYASYARGFRSGEWNGNIPNDNPTLWHDVKPETIDSFEIGIKSAGSRFSFDAAAFYYDYKNLQVSNVIVNPDNSVTPVLQNAPKAKIKGVEANFTYALTDNFNIRGGGTYLHARYGKGFIFEGIGVSNDPNYGAVTCGNGNAAQQANCGGLGINSNADPLQTYYNVSRPQDISGLQMARAPEWEAYLGADYTIPIGEGGFTLAGNMKWKDDYVVSNPSVWGTGPGVPVDRQREQRFVQKGFVLFNASLTYTDPSDTFYARVWGNNLSDKRYKMHYNGTTTFGTYAPMAEPRTYGITVGMKFAEKDKAEVVAPPPPPPPPAPPAPPPPPEVVCNKGPYIVFFDWDRSDITPEAGTVLDSAVSAYANCDRIPIMLAGHADRSGSANYNVGLSQRRNTSVHSYLTARGIPDGNISSQGFGESQPRVPTADGVRELQNRRVEITYGPGSGM